MLDMKAARRQAYRYGRQIALVAGNDGDVSQLRGAANSFIAQFLAYEGGETVHGSVINSFNEGLTGSTDYDVAAKFTLPTSTDPMYITS